MEPGFGTALFVFFGRQRFLKNVCAVTEGCHFDCCLSFYAFLIWRRLTLHRCHSPLHAGARFSLLRLRKAQRSGAFQSLTLPSFSESSCCPDKALQSYVERFAPRRNGENTKFLFIGLIASLKNITSSTISRWIRDVLQSSGIVSNVFGAHSARGTGTS